MKLIFGDPLMDALLIFTVAVLAYWFIGAAILATVDRDGRIHDWVKDAPADWLGVLPSLLWPVLVAFTLWGRWKGRET